MTLSLQVPFGRLRDWTRRFRPDRGSAVPPPDALAPLAGAIHEAQEALVEFGHCSGDEFNALADRLGELDTKLARVSEEAARLDAVLQENDEDRALTSAFTLYKKSVDLAHASIGIALSQEEQMELMEDRLLQNRNKFAKNSLMFRVLVMNIRAEAARISADDRAVFVSVAAEMAAMEEQMSSAVETAFSKLEAIVREAASDRSQLDFLRTTLHESAQVSIGRLRTELDQIKSGLAPCVQASREITDLIRRTKAQTGTLIMSLQYQDIVTQQLAHVRQGFDDIAHEIAPDDVPGMPDRAFLHQTSRIQQRQLETARRAIQDAADRIGQASADLLATGATLFERFKQMEVTADAVFRGSDIGAMFRTETERLVAIAGQSEATSKRIAALLDRIESTVQLFSTEIRHHELEVQLVALNAQIAAARMPDAPALNKLAEETAQLSNNAAQLTRQMRDQLNETLRHLNGMRAEAEEVRQTIGSEKADLEGGSATVSAKLARLNDRIHRSSGETGRQFEAAYQGVRDLLPSLSFPNLIAPAFSPSENLCTQLLERTAEFAQQPLNPEAAARLAAHQQRYTMREERESHSAALSPGTVAAVAAAAPDIELFGDAPAGTDGANVDLFSEPAPTTATPGLELFDEPSTPAESTPESAIENSDAPAHELAASAPAGAKESLGPGVELF